MPRFSSVASTHKQQALLSMNSEYYHKHVRFFFGEALGQDRGPLGDITSEALIDSGIFAKAQLKLKKSGIIAGFEELAAIIPLYNLSWTPFCKDGDKRAENTVIAEISGKALDILLLERTILNFLQRLSGIATLTSQYVSKVSDSAVLVCPTRKTLWPMLDKKACLAGGGGTHRLDLSNATLIKDNHLVFYHEDFGLLFEKLASSRNLGNFFEIEVENPDQAFAVANAYHKIIFDKHIIQTPFFIMFDNMKPGMIVEILEEFTKHGWYEHMYYEASGGITLENIEEYARSGVDIISIGALTHSAPALDISLEMF